LCRHGKGPLLLNEGTGVAVPHSGHFGCFAFDIHP